MASPMCPQVAQVGRRQHAVRRDGPGGGGAGAQGLAVESPEERGQEGARRMVHRTEYDRVRLVWLGRRMLIYPGF